MVVSFMNNETTTVNILKLPGQSNSATLPTQWVQSVH